MNEVFTLPNIIVTVVGVFAPFVVQVITRLVLNEWWRFLISMLLSGVTGVVAFLVLKIPVSAESIGAFIALASAAYKLFWKPIWKKNGSILNAPATTYK